MATIQGLCGGNFPRASDVSSKYVAIIHCTTASRSVGHPCLVSLLYIPSLHSPFFNWTNFFIYLSPFLFLLHSHASCAIEKGTLGHNSHNKVTLVALSYRLRHFVVILYFSAPSFIGRGPTIRKLEAQTPFTSFYYPRLFVVVYKLVISFLMNSYHGTSVYQDSLLEDPQ